MKLILSGALVAQIATEAQAAFPRECCGLIEGVWEADVAHALRLYPTPNRAVRADRFEIDPAAHLAAQKSARAAGRQMLGCYHSHPNGLAYPSPTDAQSASEEGFLWLIAALNSSEAAPVLGAYRYSAGGFGEVGLATGADLVTSSSKLR